jgi:DedD protein
VTNSHEPSYYEIALTNRQVVVAFVILLICLVSAFFSGLWIGRESSARAQEQIVRNTPPATAQPQEGQALDELEFFDQENQPGNGAQGPAAPPQTPSQDTTTLLEDFGGDTEDTAAGDPDLPEGRRRQGRDAEEEAADPEEEPAAPAPAPPVTPAPSPAPPAAAATPAKPEPRLRTGQVVIQVFSSADVDQAESVRDRLARGGHKAFLSPVQVGGRTMYRVRVGPFDSRGDAQKVAEQVRKGYKLDTWVTE